MFHKFRAYLSRVGIYGFLRLIPSYFHLRFKIHNLWSMKYWDPIHNTRIPFAVFWESKALKKNDVPATLWCKKDAEAFSNWHNCLSLTIQRLMGWICHKTGQLWLTLDWWCVYEPSHIVIHSAIWCLWVRSAPLGEFGNMLSFLSMLVPTMLCHGVKPFHHTFV